MKVLLIDALPVVYANFAKIGHLSTSSGIPTGLRFGFIRTVRSYRERSGCDRVVIAWDTPHPIIKAQGVEEFYKAGREKTITEGAEGKKVDKKVMYDQIPALKEMLAMTSWTQVEAPGYEADDLLGHFARQIEDQGHTPVIFTTDNDLAQAVTDKTVIFYPKSERHGRKKDTIKDLEWVRNTFGVTGRAIPYYRAVLGDKSDNLEGMIKVCTIEPEEDPIWAVRKALEAGPPKDVLDFINGVKQFAPKFGHELAANGDKLEGLVRVMSLHDPEEKVITKGSKDQAGLTTLFQDLQFNSLMKFIPEYCQ